jgi:hypothetical protein
MIKETIKGALIATAVASLFAAGPASAGEKHKGKAKEAEKTVVQCAGVNECKGKGNCSGASNSCASQNECKGKGWVELSAKDCKAKGGTEVAKK